MDGKTQVDEGKHSQEHGRYPRLEDEELHFEIVIYYSSSVWVGSCTKTGNGGHDIGLVTCHQMPAVYQNQDTWDNQDHLQVTQFQCGGA